MKPTTPLPWRLDDDTHIGTDDTTVCHQSVEMYRDGAKQDMQYLVHAANAYPKLVALVRDWADEYGHGSFGKLLEELGEDD